MERTKKEIRQRKARYHNVLSKGDGPWVLGDFLEYSCAFSSLANTEEIATRQAVGKELLVILDIWFGQGQTTSARQFVTKLMRPIVGEQEHGRSNRSDRK